MTPTSPPAGLAWVIAGPCLPRLGRWDVVGHEDGRDRPSDALRQRPLDVSCESLFQLLRCNAIGGGDACHVSIERGEPGPSQPLLRGARHDILQIREHRQPEQTRVDL